LSDEQVEPDRTVRRAVAALCEPLPRWCLGIGARLELAAIVIELVGSKSQFSNSAADPLPGPFFALKIPLPV